ncbi:uncharacterized protein LOC116167034 isoform X2 [Photinus pyralis]|uniref:uncharacterized protein LOC116167034 isoform X2 n=1 Tax=Photinus pyralis TaxID=7054 RepID=UPI001266EF38|nr:uncharacterized protein LOC116167034 isoform X2 [Photinus pyralis]
MGKWAKYVKQHRKEWEEEKQFKELRSHRGDLIRHATTSKHKSNMSKINNHCSLRNFGVVVCTDQIKRKELILASFIANHTSIRSIDHLSEILNKFCEHQNKPSSSAASNVDTLHLHKTKCAALIRNVIAPSLLNELVEDLSNSPFSIIVDESTDVSTDKLLCINIKYYSVKSNAIKLQFLTFVSVTKTTAEDLYNAVTDYLLANKFHLQNLLGIGTDGANNMCGEHNSLYTLLKKNLNLNNLVLVKCICHSLHLCTSKASEVFSDEIDFLLRETYSWFRHSALRLSKYKEIYSLINLDSKFTKFVQLSSTRWLSRYKAVQKILSQYLELETFFNIHADKERCHTAKLLSNAYTDKKNKVILTFIQPILKQISCLNAYFQKQGIDYYLAFQEINVLIWTLVRQIIKPTLITHFKENLDLLKNSMLFEQNYLRLESCDFGHEFEQELKSSNLSLETATEIRRKARDFIKELILELIKRMPSHLNIFSQVKMISPKVILNPLRPKYVELPLKLVPNINISDMEVQYRQLLNVEWDQVFPENIPEDTVEFWQKVITLKNAAGQLLYKDISLFAFALLTLPSSNAAVERSFSMMTIVKSKLRNQMMLNLLNSIVFIRAYFNVNSICCKSFEPTKDMFSAFNSKMYQNNSEISDVDDDTNNINYVDDVILLCNETL